LIDQVSKLQDIVSNIKEENTDESEDLKSSMGVLKELNQNLEDELVKLRNTKV